MVRQMISAVSCAISLSTSISAGAASLPQRSHASLAVSTMMGLNSASLDTCTMGATMRRRRRHVSPSLTNSPSPQPNGSSDYLRWAGLLPFKAFIIGTEGELYQELRRIAQENFTREKYLHRNRKPYSNAFSSNAPIKFRRPKRTLLPGRRLPRQSIRIRWYKVDQRFSLWRLAGPICRAPGTPIDVSSSGAVVTAVYRVCVSSPSSGLIPVIEPNGALARA